MAAATRTYTGTHTDADGEIARLDAYCRLVSQATQIRFSGKKPCPCVNCAGKKDISWETMKRHWKDMLTKSSQLAAQRQMRVLLGSANSAAAAAAPSSSAAAPESAYDGSDDMDYDSTSVMPPAATLTLQLLPDAFSYSAMGPSRAASASAAAGLSFVPVSLEREKLADVSAWSMAMLLAFMMRTSTPASEVQTLLRTVNGMLEGLGLGEACLPVDMRTVFRRLGASEEKSRDDFDLYVVCTRPQCAALRKLQGDERKSKRIVHEEHKRCAVCRLPLVEQKRARLLGTPKALLPMRSVERWLNDILARNHGELAAKLWDCMENVRMDGHYFSHFDGRLWQDQLSGGLMDHSTVQLGLYFDHVQTAKGNSSSVGVLYMFVLNFPVELAQRVENTLLLCVTNSGAKQNMNAIVGELVSELQHWAQPRPLAAVGKPVRFILSGVFGDLPAMAKLMGFTGHSGVFGCAWCKSALDRASKSVYVDGSDEANLRTSAEHRHYVQRYKRIHQLEEQLELEKWRERSVIERAVPADVQPQRRLRRAEAAAMSEESKEERQAHARTRAKRRRRATQAQPALPVLAGRAAGLRQKIAELRAETSRFSGSASAAAAAPVPAAYRLDDDLVKLRWSPIWELAYFDIRAVCVDPLHNFWQGHAKRLHRYTVQSLLTEAGSNSNTANSEEAIHAKMAEHLRKCCQLPSGVLDLSTNVAHLMSNFRASDWKLWTLAYALFAYEAVGVDKRVLEAWCSFIRGCQLVYKSVLRQADIDGAHASFMQHFQQCNELVRVGLFGEGFFALNQHIICHLKRQLENWGPAMIFSTWFSERLNGFLADQPMSSTFRNVQIFQRFLTLSDLMSEKVVHAAIAAEPDDEEHAHEEEGAPYASTSQPRRSSSKATHRMQILQSEDGPRRTAFIPGLNAKHYALLRGQLMHRSRLLYPIISLADKLKRWRAMDFANHYALSAGDTLQQQLQAFSCPEAKPRTPFSPKPAYLDDIKSMIISRCERLFQAMKESFPQEVEEQKFELGEVTELRFYETFLLRGELLSSDERANRRSVQSTRISASSFVEYAPPSYIRRKLVPQSHLSKSIKNRRREDVFPEQNEFGELGIFFTMKLKYSLAGVEQEQELQCVNLLPLKNMKDVELIESEHRQWRTEQFKERSIWMGQARSIGVGEIYDPFKHSPDLYPFFPNTIIIPVACIRARIMRFKLSAEQKNLPYRSSELVLSIPK